jgi:MFS family permease
MKLGATGALALAAASTGVVVPVLRPLVEDSGYGPIAAGVFIAAHVVGGVVGAGLGAPALRRAGSARRLAAIALATSIVVTLAMAAIPSLEIRIGLRLLDGGCHLLAITALVAAATAGDATARARRAVLMGLAIVLGVAAGLGIGAALGHPAAARVLAALGHPEAALVAAALLSAAALVTVVAQVPDEPLPAVAPSRAQGRPPIAPGLLAFGERFIFGTLSVAMPYLAPPSRVGLVLGVFMTASVIALPIARRYALVWGPRRLAVRSTLAFALTLGAAGAVDVLASAGTALLWAVVCGTSAGALYASALVLAARSVALDERMRDMGAVHAAGSAGHAIGALTAGLLVAVLPGMLVVALPGVAIIVAATLGVWITVPAAARDCPVIGGLAAITGDGEPSQPATDRGRSSLEDSRLRG